MNKIYPTAQAALEGLRKDGTLIAPGRFGFCGLPERLLDAIRDSGVKDLAFASNDAGIDSEGIGRLDPDAIHLPALYVQRLIVGSPDDKKIEFRTVRARAAA